MFMNMKANNTHRYNTTRLVNVYQRPQVCNVKYRRVVSFHPLSQYPKPLSVCLHGRELHWRNAAVFFTLYMIGINLNTKNRLIFLINIEKTSNTCSRLS